MQHLTVLELAALPSSNASALQLLDVREHWEFELAQLKGSIHIPLGELAQRVDDLDKTRPVLCICHHGVRSLHAGQFLERQGFASVINLTGGIDAWSTLVDKNCPSY
jgi:rhodanese-related sulfurtransferase